MSNILLCGWIPPEERNIDQAKLTERFHSQIPIGRDLSEIDLPEMSVGVVKHLRRFRKPKPRVEQSTGSCVGAGGIVAVVMAMLGDVLRGDFESVELPFWLPTYGQSRLIGGLRGPGDGSFGAAFARAVKEFGLIPQNHPLAVKPQMKGHWAYYEPDVERHWSWPPKWRDRDKFVATAADYQVLNTYRITTTNELAQAIAKNHGVAKASMFGTAMRPPIKNGVLLADWTDTWAHQVTIDSYVTHPDLGRIWLDLNQWHNAHGICPYLQLLIREACEDIGLAYPGDEFGCFWLLDRTMGKILAHNQTEMYGFSDTEGVPLDKIDWSSVPFA